MHAAHLFLGDEFRQAVGERFTRAFGQTPLDACFNVEHVEIAVADAGQQRAVGRELGVYGCARVAGQFLYTAGRPLDHEQPSRQWHEHAAAVARQFVGGDAARRQPHPLARLFFVGQLFFCTAEQLLRGGQHALFAGRDVKFIEICAQNSAGRNEERAPRLRHA